MKDRISHTIRPLDYKNVCIEEIKKYILIIKNQDIHFINFNIKMFEKINDYSSWVELAQEVKKFADENDMQIPVTHATYNNSLVLSDGFDDDLIKRIKAGIEVTRIFNAKTMVIHPGISYSSGKYDETRTVTDNTEYFKEVVLLAEKDGITVAFENDIVADITDEKHIFKPSVITVNDLVNNINNLYGTHTKICYDLGHANISWGYVEDLQKINKNLGCFHIHNNQGYTIKNDYWKNDTHNPCYDGIIDYELFFKNLKKIGYTGDIVIESVYRDAEPLLSKSIKKDYQFIKKLSES